MGTNLKVEGSNINFELNGHEITGYKFNYTVPNSKYAKGYKKEQYLQVTGNISRIIEKNELILNGIRNWSDIEYRGEDYYSKVTVTQTYMEEIIRRIIFTYGYIKDYKESIDTHTGHGTFEIIFMQKEDKLDELIVEPKSEEFCIKSIKDNQQNLLNPVDNDKLKPSIIPIILPPKEVEIPEDAPPLAGVDIYTPKPVMLSYLVSAKGSDYKTNLNTTKNCIEIYKYNKVIMEVYGYKICEGRAFISSNTDFLKANFEDFKNAHSLDNLFNSEEDALLALGSIYYGNNPQKEKFKIEKMQLLKNYHYIIIKSSISNKYPSKSNLGPDIYYKVSNNKVYKVTDTKNSYIGSNEKELYDMKSIMDSCSNSYGKVPVKIINKVPNESNEKGIYTYINKKYNNVSLHMIKTHADNIGFKALNFKGNLDSSGEFGMNGGFFNPPSQGGGTLSIAVKNGVPVISKEGNGRMGNYMSGENGSGTIIYTGSAMKCMIVHEEWDIYNYVESYMWAQGGISMSLGNSNWEDISRKEKYGSYLVREDCYSAMIADSDCNIYLIVTDSSVIPGEFREAIQQYFNIKDGTSTNIIGIFLDGSTCAQLKCKEKNITYSRNLSTIITLESKE